VTDDQKERIGAIERAFAAPTSGLERLQSRLGDAFTTTQNVPSSGGPLTLEALKEAIQSLRAQGTQTGRLFSFEGRNMTVDDIKKILMTWDDRKLQNCKNQQLLSIFEEEIARRASAPREEHVVREELIEVRHRLDFRSACDAACIEGQLARSTGLDIGVNPYVGYERAERLCGEGTPRTMQEFHLAWMMGWRAADEQDAIDALLVAAQASTRDGTVTPACPAGEGLREAVAALLARRVKG
jgi:hypothetical protein